MQSPLKFDNNSTEPFKLATLYSNDYKKGTNASENLITISSSPVQEENNCRYRQEHQNLRALKDS